MAGKNLHRMNPVVMRHGAVGFVRCIHSFFVLPGDILRYALSGNFRQSPLRLPLAISPRVDMFATMTPFRHAHGDDWISFMKQGIDEDKTFNNTTVTSQGGELIGLNALDKAKDVPYPLVVGVNRTWNRFVRDPSHPSELPDNHDPLNTFQVNAESISVKSSAWGRSACHLRHIATAHPQFVRSDDDLKVAVASGKWSLLDFAQAQARLRSETERELFGRRYNDLMRNLYGVKINVDADERPRLLGRKTWWLSGHDVDGTDAQKLGQTGGKSASQFRFRFRTMPQEHSVVQVFALVRYPPIFQFESNPLYAADNFDYRLISGEREYFEKQPPVTYDRTQWLKGTAAESPKLRKMPYGQEWRTLPNCVDGRFFTLQGYPFVRKNDHGSLPYYNGHDDYDHVFQSLALKHWNINAVANVDVVRNIPSPMASWFAGAE